MLFCFIPWARFNGIVQFWWDYNSENSFHAVWASHPSFSAAVQFINKKKFAHVIPTRRKRCNCPLKWYEHNKFHSNLSDSLLKLFKGLHFVMIHIDLLLSKNKSVIACCVILIKHFNVFIAHSFTVNSFILYGNFKTIFPSHISLSLHCVILWRGSNCLLHSWQVPRLSISIEDYFLPLMNSKCSE